MFIEKPNKARQKVHIFQLPNYHWFQHDDCIYMWMDSSLLKSTNCINLTLNKEEYLDVDELVVPVVMFGSPKPLSNAQIKDLLDQKPF